MKKYFHKPNIYNKKLCLNYLKNKRYKSTSIFEKVEKSNTALIFQQEKINKPKFIKGDNRAFFFFKLTEELTYEYRWDDEKKLINLLNRREYTGMFISKKTYIHIEEFLNFNRVIIQPEIYKKNNLNILDWIIRAHLSSLSFQEIFLFLSFRNFDYRINRFFMRTKCKINPNFICWSSNKDSKKVFSVMIYKIDLINASCYNISVFCARIKPCILKLVCFGTFSFVFFSIESGFSSYCPLYLQNKNKYIVYL